MTTTPPRLTEAEIDALLDALGGAPSVTYAPPHIFPMSAPVFDEAPGADRGDPPAGPLGVYVHVPYCNYKCMFCFYVTELKPDVARMERYVRALERELAWIPSGTPLSQLYVGGGTPTALPPDLLDRVLAAVFARVEPGEEVDTVECSPESVTDAHVEVLLRHGIERVSMGVQSEDAGIRRAINRRHETDHVHEAIVRLVDAGLVVNVDLIYGLPGQTEEGFRHDFRVVADLGVHALTTYNLRVNETTPVGRLLAPEERLDGPRLVRWRETVRDAACDQGFERTR
jgi:oxygen-independent coproporphyrinogen-3 oxidase